VKTSSATFWLELLISCLALGWFGLNANAKLLFYDGFDYTAGEELGESVSNPPWENDKTQFKIVAGSLTFPGLRAAAGNRVGISATEPNLDSVRTHIGAWPEQTNGCLYVSFLLRVESTDGIDQSGHGTSLVTINGSAKNSVLFGVNLLNESTTRFGVVKYPSSAMAVSAVAFVNSGIGANLSINRASTYLVVAKYTWKDGPTNDEVTLWVNPGTLGREEDAGPRLSIRGGADGLNGAARVLLSRGPNISLDELRIGQTWADVTPLPVAPHHWMVTAGVFGCALAIAGLWIARLRRKIEERSVALKAQVQERQLAEQQRFMEQERARIARDLHDELGADITEISMLATRAQTESPDRPEGRLCLEQMTDKTRQMVSKLEEIVWAMNPQHDSLGALVTYFSFYADRFLGLANIRLTIDTAAETEGLAVEARVRHQLFLALKEALANVVKHSGATEVCLAVRAEGHLLSVEVADNGRGFQSPDVTEGGHDGIANMQRRMDKLEGQFSIVGEPGRGTVIKFLVPLK